MKVIHHLRDAVSTMSSLMVRPLAMKRFVLCTLFQMMFFVPNCFLRMKMEYFVLNVTQNFAHGKMILGRVDVPERPC